MHPRLRVQSIAALFAVTALSLGACAPSLADYAAQRLRAAQADVNRLPGAKQVLAYAEAYERAVELNAFPKKGTHREDTGEDVIVRLSAVIDQGHPDAPILRAHRGVIHCILGRCVEGEADLEAANSARPSAYSTYWLVLRHGRTNRTNDVARVCAHAIPQILEEQRYDLINHCREQMNAATVETSMAWADRETFAWYLREMDRRDRAEAAAEAQRAHRAAERRRVEREIEVCSADCRERALRCQNKCREQPNCLNRCVDIDDACRSGCVAEGNRKLGL